MFDAGFSARSGLDSAQTEPFPVSTIRTLALPFRPFTQSAKAQSASLVWPRPELAVASPAAGTAGFSRGGEAPAAAAAAPPSVKSRPIDRARTLPRSTRADYTNRGNDEPSNLGAGGVVGSRREPRSSPAQRERGTCR